MAFIIVYKGEGLTQRVGGKKTEPKKSGSATQIFFLFHFFDPVKLGVITGTFSRFN